MSPGTRDLHAAAPARPCRRSVRSAGCPLPGPGRALLPPGPRPTPTDDALAQGGYETEFGRWSVVAPVSEPVLRSGALTLLDDLHAALDVHDPSATRRP